MTSTAEPWPSPRSGGHALELGLSELGLQVEPPTDDWRRPRPNIAALRMDIVAGIALAVGSIVTLPLYMWAGITPANDLPDWLALLWSVAVTLPIGWRRRAPVRIAVAVSAVFIAGGIAFGSGLFFPTIALFVVIYTVGAWVDDRRLARWARLGIIAAMGLWIVGAIFYYSTSPAHNQDPVRGGPFSPLVAGTLINISINAVFFAGAYYFGERGYASAITHDTLLRRNAELDAERAKSADQAVALDRTRIARDLHDVVGHHVSVMGVQASAARVALDKDPQLAQTSLSEVENNARTAIEELHGLLTTLRAAEPDNNTPATGGSNPRARVDDLTSLTRQMSSSGVPTRLEIIGSPVQLGDVLSLNLYRITQEALTNVGKHAGTTATADVRLRYLGDEVELEIRNSGAMVSRRSPSGGLGQLGMRERVAACQGSIELGPLQRGGYLVRARMPIHAQNQQLAGPEPGRSDGPS